MTNELMETLNGPFMFTGMFNRYCTGSLPINNRKLLYIKLGTIYITLVIRHKMCI